MTSVLYVLMVKSFMTNTRISFLGVIARRSLARSSFPSYHVPFGYLFYFLFKISVVVPIYFYAVFEQAAAAPEEDDPPPADDVDADPAAELEEYFQSSVSNTFTRPLNWSKFSANNALRFPSLHRL